MTITITIEERRDQSLSVAQISDGFGKATGLERVFARELFEILKVSVPRIHKTLGGASMSMVERDAPPATGGAK